MDSDECDEAIVSARIEGTSTRALAKIHGCTGSEIEAAIDRRLSYELDNRQRLRAVKLSAARLDALMVPFFEKAMKGDAQAGLLCVKIEERLALLFGLDQPTTSRVDVYAVQQAQQPPRFEKLYSTIMGFKHRNDPLNGNGNALAPPIDPSADDQNRADSEQSSTPTKDAT